SARATVKAFTDERLTFPLRVRTGARKGVLAWAPLRHWRVLKTLHNPRYAGAFCFGRRHTRAGPGGKPTVVELPREQWTALIPDAHDGYIGWEEFETNLARLAECAAAHGSDRRASPPREGPALLQGLVVCGACGRRMTVRYHARRGGHHPDYTCQAENVEAATGLCQAVPGTGVDAAVGALLLDTLTPLSLEVAMSVADELDTRADEADRLRA